MRQKIYVLELARTFQNQFSLLIESHVIQIATQWFKSNSRMESSLFCQPNNFKSVFNH